MIFTSTPIARLSTSLTFSICCACMTSTALAQASYTAAEAPLTTQSSPLPADVIRVIRSTGKWLDKSALDNPPNASTLPSSMPSTTPAPVYFKPVEPGWTSALDAASYFAAGFAPTRALAPSRPVNIYNAPPAPDNTNAPGR